MAAASPSSSSFTNLFLIIFSLFFAAATCNSTSTRASYLYHLDSGFPSTWYNSNSVIMEGWEMRVFLVYPKGPRFYCGFYCTATCENYTFSVVQVTGDNASVVWSANKDRLVQKDAMVQLSRRQGLSLRHSNGTQVWSTNITGQSIAGMNCQKL